MKVNMTNAESLIDVGLDITSFYDNSTVLITGGTGFLGKALIEKLLRCCSNITCIYILIRPKHGLSADKRYHQFIYLNVFDRLRESNPGALKKIRFLSGDIKMKNLGIRKKQMDIVCQSVNIVFHSAATVRFNEDLKQAGALNSCGTKSLMELCLKIKKLKAVIYVSTAYCNPGRKYVQETVYCASSSSYRRHFINLVNRLPASCLNSVSSIAMGLHPNNYTLTKSIAEQIVCDFGGILPVSIVRPSIVTAAFKEPYPGWIDNIQGITGIMMEIGRGTLTSILGNSNLICDIIPVDFVVNTMIAAAADTAKKQHGVKVFNCTSGQINPISWEALGKLTLKWARINPSKYTVLYPQFSYTTNKALHRVIVLLLHLLPAKVLDLILKLQGKASALEKMTRKFQIACIAGSYFALHEWKFGNINQHFLNKTTCNSSNCNELKANVCILNYDIYIRNYMTGIRRFILLDTSHCERNFSRRKIVKLYWFYLFIRIVIIEILFYTVA